MSSEPYAADREAVHEQKFDGFGTVRVLPVDPGADLDVIHRWVSEERAVFWGMNGLTKQQVLETYVHLDSSTPTTPSSRSRTAIPPRSSRRTSPRPTGSASATPSNPATSASTC